jgi:NADPH:quinone reductase-like Zn-dependent oxidoreductase
MKAYAIKDTFGIDSLILTERPEPTPGANQVLIKLRAVSLNARDLMVVKGVYTPIKPLPLIPVSDGVGEVIAVGEGVKRVKIGDRVASIFMQKWLAGKITEEKAKSDLGGSLDGMLVEYAVLHEDGVVHVPEHLSDEEAATLPCAGVTAWHALITEGDVKAGETVLLQGTGGVSMFALQFAKIAGARVIVTSSSDEKLERVRQLGASHEINYKQTPNWDEKARELTQGIGLDHIMEVGGAGTLAKSLRAVRLGGQISLIGVLTGMAADFNIVPIVQQNVRVQGIHVGHRDMFEDMNRAIALHQLRPIVDRVFSFDETPEAFEYMEKGAHFGKICIRF